MDLKRRVNIHKYLFEESRKHIFMDQVQNNETDKGTKKKLSLFLKESKKNLLIRCIKKKKNDIVALIDSYDFFVLLKGK